MNANARQTTSTYNNTDPITKTAEIQLPIPTERLIALQKADQFIEKLRHKWDNNELDTNIYLLKDNILK